VTEGCCEEERTGGYSRCMGGLKFFERWTRVAAIDWVHAPGVLKEVFRKVGIGYVKTVHSVETKAMADSNMRREEPTERSR